MDNVLTIRALSMSVVTVLGPRYLGLPLVVKFAKVGRTIGFDIVAEKVAKCGAGTDPSREMRGTEMAPAGHAAYTSNVRGRADQEWPCARAARYEVELPGAWAGSCRRPLDRRRPLTPGARGRDTRLSPVVDPGRAAHQRRHGQVPRGSDRQADVRRGQCDQGARRSLCSG